MEDKQKKKEKGGKRGRGGEVRELAVRLGSMRFFRRNRDKRDEGSSNRPTEKEKANKNEGNESCLRVVSFRR